MTHATAIADRSSQNGSGQRLAPVGPESRPLSSSRRGLRIVRYAEESPPTLVDLVKAASAAVGRVNMFSLSNNQRRQIALGSFFLVYGRDIPGGENLPEVVGYTCFHCVDQVDELEGVFPGGKKFKMTPLGVNPEADCAVVALEGDLTGLTALSLPIVDGKIAPPDRGSRSYAFGHPLGLQPEDGQPTVTAGIVSNVLDFEGPFGGLAKNVIYMDTPINPGNSGGPLVNERGEILGQNSWGLMEAENVGFAPSSEHPTNLAASLKPGDRALRVFDHSVVVQSHLGPMIVAARPSSRLAPFQASKTVPMPLGLRFGRIGDWFATRGALSAPLRLRERQARREFRRFVRVPDPKNMSVITHVKGKRVTHVEEIRQILDENRFRPSSVDLRIARGLQTIKTNPERGSVPMTVPVDYRKEE